MMDKTSLFQPLKRETLSDMVVTRISEMVLDGTLRPGEQLLPEVRLADELGVGRTTVREALKALCLTGLLVRSNSGTFVSENPSLIGKRALVYQLGQSGTLREIYEARRTLEVEIAGLAAIRAQEDDLKRIEECIVVERSIIGNWEERLKADIAFHVAVADAAQSPVLFELYAVVCELMIVAHRAIYSRVQADYFDWGVSNHKKLYGALAQGDALRAKLLVREALNAAELRMVELYEDADSGETQTTQTAADLDVATA